MQNPGKSHAPETEAYHALRVAGLSYGRLAKLRTRYGTWQNAWRAAATPGDTGSAMLELARLGIRLILLEDPDYPPRLAQIPLPPFGIYLKGSLPDKTKPALAIVGTRRATDSGRKLAQKFASRAAELGTVIVSGLAFGADISAHLGCLASGGQAIAVLASGVDQITPRSNTALGNRIIESGGGILSEYPPRTKIRLQNFLERNRIVSGLSQAVLVIEAPARSGSLATARFALDQNRDVLVVPGPAGHPNYEGSHELIRSGATLISTAAHLFSALGIQVEPKDFQIPAEISANPENNLILEALRSSAEPLSIDKLTQITKLEVQIVNRAVNLMLLQNVLQEEPAGYTLQTGWR